MGSDTFGDRPVGDPDKHPLSARAVAANAASKKRGTGYIADTASWERQNSRRFADYPIDHSAQPWGSDGGPSAADEIPAPDESLYYARYAEGTRPVDEGGVSCRGIGAWGESIGMNVDGLRRWYAQQSPQHQAEWDGEPTVQEVYDAAFSQPRLGSFYRAPVVDDPPPPPPPPPDEEDEKEPPPPPPPPPEPKYERLVPPPGIADTMAKIGNWIPESRPKLRKRAQALEAWLNGLELYVRVK